MKLKIDKEFERLIPPTCKEERNLLKQSIIKEGCRDPIDIWNGLIIDGHNRYEICKRQKMSFKTRINKFVSREEVKIWIINNQLSRRNISNFDRVRLALKKEDFFKKEAKEHQKKGGGSGISGRQISAQPRKVREQVAKIANVSHDTVVKVKFIEKHAVKEQKERLSTQQDSINKVYHEVKKKESLKEKKKIPLPKEKFNIIYADPPWRYNFSQTNERSVETHYSSMSLKQIKEMNIPTEANAVLLLWTTAPKLREAFEVIDAWGFEYKTCAVWDKEIIGMGYWFRGQHEILLLATKGKVKTPEPKNRFSSVIKSRRTNHSKKPEVVYKIIEKMFPHSKYLELFARNKRDKWVSWGDELKR